MKTIDIIASVLVIVGALNWGLVGVLHFNLVARLLGDGTPLANAVYALVGLAGAFQALGWKAIQRRWGGEAILSPARATR